jgi:hypothetical protein
MIFAALRYPVNGCVDVGIQSEVLVVGLQNPTTALAKLTAHQTEKGSAVNSVAGHHVFN